MSSRREERRERLGKLAFTTIGLAWSDDDDLRGEAGRAGVQAILDAGLVTPETGRELIKLVATLASGQWLSAIKPALDVIRTRDEILRVFGDVWNDVILHGPAQEEEAAPRYQVPLEKAGELPQQVKDRLAAQEAKPETPAWLLPALGLGALIFLWRR